MSKNYSKQNYNNMLRWIEKIEEEKSSNFSVRAYVSKSGTLEVEDYYRYYEL